MYAIVEIAGKQYKIEKGLKFFVDRIIDPKKFKIDKVLFFNDDKEIKIGTPYLSDISIKSEIINPEIKDKKVIVFKYKNKTGYHKKQGHRQLYTEVFIKDINAGKTEDKTVVVKASEAKETVVKNIEAKEVEKSVPKKAVKKASKDN